MTEMTMTQAVEMLRGLIPDETAEEQIGEVRAALKRAGFRWSPSNGCWQSYRGERYSVALRGILQGAQ